MNKGIIERLDRAEGVLSTIAKKLATKCGGSPIRLVDKDKDFNSRINLLSKNIRKLFDSLCCDTDIPKIFKNQSMFSKLNQIEKLLILLENSIEKCSPLTTFFVGPTPVVECMQTPETETFQLWHNGASAVPVFGDIIYEDAAGLMPFVTTGTDVYYSSTIVGDSLKTDEFGVLTEYVCK